MGRNRSGARSARFVEGHDFSRAVQGGKIDGASAPEVSLPLTGILRDYMPDSNEKFVGKDIVRTAWRHAESGRNVHSSPLLQAKSEKLKAKSQKLISQKLIASSQRAAKRNKLERNSLSGKFRPARMA